MADICPVCDKKIGLFSPHSSKMIQGVVIHLDCTELFLEDPEKYGGKAIEKTEDQIKAEVQRKEQQQKIEDQSVHVISFDMPFGDMVGFMVKWALASIPAFIILAIIGAIFVAIFTAIFA